MANLVPALRGQMGSTPYYVATMSARALTTTARPARDIDTWASLSIDERMQRVADINRVKQQIVPYLAEHPDRFFGAIIVLVEEGSIEFESVRDVAQGLPKVYHAESASVGFITIGKGERIILDGQHRWYGLREVIQSGEELGAEQHKVGDDDVTVIFVENVDARKTRRIFNKVNRYAKPPSKADNILISEDDGYALISRRLLDADRGGPLAPRPIFEADGSQRLGRNGEPQLHELVNWRASTLGRSSDHLTTLAAVYECVTNILKFAGMNDLDRPVAPSEKTLDEALDFVAPWFEELLEGLDAFRNAISTRESIRDVRFSGDHQHSLLLRPVGQVTVVKGLIRAMALSRDNDSGGKSLGLIEAISRLNRVDFRATPDGPWFGSIVRGNGQMVARKDATNRAGFMLAYLIAPDAMDLGMVENLRREWNESRGDGANPVELPDPVV
jgi:DNA sulfur modification protein DndB